MGNSIQRLYENGQSIWCDNISRHMIASGELQRLIDIGIVGVTSNPTIFMKAITGSGDYDDLFTQLVASGADTMAVYEGLVLPDIADAADILRPVYDRTGGVDGYVSLEVNPKLAFDTDATVAEGRRLFAALNRPNVFIKVPATEQGIPAIETLIGKGINVNVTLIFSIEMHEKVMAAYIGGLKRFAASGGDLASVASVASFFVSRLDTQVDKLLEQKRSDGVAVDHLLGRAAIANAQLAYARFEEVFDENGSFAELASQGARVQRPLWASTGTKNPAYKDTMYCDGLVAPNSVNTLPPATIAVVLDRGATVIAIHDDLDAARSLFGELADLGVTLGEVTDQLQRDGVELFAKSFEELLTNLAAREASGCIR